MTDDAPTLGRARATHVATEFAFAPNLHILQAGLSAAAESWTVGLRAAHVIGERNLAFWRDAAKRRAVASATLGERDAASGRHLVNYMKAEIDETVNAVRGMVDAGREAGFRALYLWMAACAGKANPSPR